MTKKNWQDRKNKAAFYYYLLMILLAFFGLLILFGIITKQDMQDWWQM